VCVPANVLPARARAIGIEISRWGAECEYGKRVEILFFYLVEKKIR